MTNRRPSRVFAALVALGCSPLWSACSRRAPTSFAALDRQAFEDLLISDAARANEIAAAVGACMRDRGFDAPTTVALPPPPQTDAAESGLVSAAQAAFSAERGTSASSTPVAEPSGAYMEAWQGRVVVDGRVFDGGCEAYARDRVERAHPKQAQVESLRTRYGEAMAAVLTSEPVARLDAEWAMCMVRAGFPGLGRPGDQLSMIDGKLAAIDRRAGSDVVAAQLGAARQFDLSITAAYRQCVDAQEADRARLLDDASQRFRADNAAALAEALDRR